MQTKAVVLAAGRVTRMRSELPKVLHAILGHPLAWYALEASRQATQTQPVMVIGHAWRGRPPGLRWVGGLCHAGTPAWYRSCGDAG